MHSPFKFLDSYTREDKDLFFGRKTEIEELYTRIYQSNLLEKLSPEKTDIELTYLQVFLDKLYKLNPHKFTNNSLEQIGRVGDVLASFLEEQVSHIPDSESALNVLKAFVSVEGTKKQMSYSEIREFTLSIGKNIPEEKIEALVHQFVDLRILRDKDEQGKYELRHDALAAKIYEKITVVEKELMEVSLFIENAFKENRKRRVWMNEEDLNYINPYENKLFVNEETRQFLITNRREIYRRRTRRKRIVYSLSAMAMVIMIGFTWWALRERGRAEVEKKNAESQYKMAEIARNEAEKLKIKAENALNLFKNEQYKTRESEKQAVDAKNKAEEMTSIATKEKERAEDNENTSLILQIMAENRRQEAEKSRTVAEIEKLRADKAEETKFNSQEMGSIISQVLQRIDSDNFSMDSSGRFIGRLADDEPTYKIYQQEILLIFERQLRIIADKESKLSDKEQEIIKRELELSNKYIDKNPHTHEVEI